LHHLWKNGKEQRGSFSASFWDLEGGAMPVGILLADGHGMFREMLKDALARRGGAYTLLGEAKDGMETLRLVAHHHPNILLLDYKMPGLNRLSTFCQKVTHRSPTTRILLLSGYTSEEPMREAAIGGAHGYILKGSSLADLSNAIDTIQRGGIWVDPSLPPQIFRTFFDHRRDSSKNLGHLSRQEFTILSLVAQRMKNEIATCLYISQKTVKNHLTHIFAKLGVANRQEAVRYFLSGKRSE
jgi:two-component system, NarL family, response regulator DegU